MLALLEKKLHGAVKEALAGRVKVTCGPTTGPSSRTEHKVVVEVRGFEASTASGGQEILAGRERAWRRRTHTWNASGTEKNFRLPEDVHGSVVEAQAPPGHPVLMGDDCFVDGAILRFYHPPPKGKPGVAAVLRGDPAKGYQESRTCRIEAGLTVWSKKMQDADRLFARSFNGLLAAFVDMGTIRAPRDDSGVALCLTKPVAVPCSMERSREKIGRAQFYRVTAAIAIFCALDICIALGAAEPNGRIQAIQYQTDPVQRSTDDEGKRR